MLVSDLVSFSCLCRSTQNAVRGDGTGTPRSIGPIRLDSELPLLARAHVEQPLVPSFDDLSLANGEGQGLAAVVRGVELAAIGEGATVMDFYLVADLGLAAALFGDDDFGFEVLWSLLAHGGFAMGLHRIVLASLLMMSAAAQPAAASTARTVNFIFWRVWAWRKCV